MRPSGVMLKERTWSINGFDLGWFFGVLKIWASISFINLRWGAESKAPSNERRGLLNLRQLPDSLSSSKVCMFTQWNLIEGPLGLFAIHRNRSLCLRCSKYNKLLQDLSKHKSLATLFTCFLSILDSFLVLGIKLVMSSIKCLILPAMPLDIRISVRCLFFHSLDWGSASLNALSSSS